MELYLEPLDFTEMEGLIAAAPVHCGVCGEGWFCGCGGCAEPVEPAPAL